MYLEQINNLSLERAMPLRILQFIWEKNSLSQKQELCQYQQVLEYRFYSPEDEMRANIKPT
jgi:hypothetical protein